jgi:hypothetical protein
MMIMTVSHCHYHFMGLHNIGLNENKQVFSLSFGQSDVALHSLGFEIPRYSYKLL